MVTTPVFVSLYHHYKAAFKPDRAQPLATVTGLAKFLSLLYLYIKSVQCANDYHSSRNVCKVNKVLYIIISGPTIRRLKICNIYIPKALLIQYKCDYNVLYIPDPWPSEVLLFLSLSLAREDFPVFLSFTLLLLLFLLSVSSFNSLLSWIDFFLGCYAYQTQICCYFFFHSYAIRKRAYKSIECCWCCLFLGVCTLFKIIIN